MDKSRLAAALNEWMRRFTEDPQAFEAEFQTVSRFLAEVANGAEPSYGEVVVEYLAEIDADLQTKAGT